MAKWSVALFGHEKPRVEGWEKRAQPGDLIDGKPEYCWNCSAEQHREILGLMKYPAWLMANKEEMRALYLASCPNETDWRPNARFERIWRDSILPRGLTMPSLMPSEIRGYFSHLPGASLWHREGEASWTPNEKRLFLIIGMEGTEAEQWTALKEPKYDLNSYRTYDPKTLQVFAQEMRASAQKRIPDTEMAKHYAEYLKAEKQACAYPLGYLNKRRFNIPLADLADLGVNTKMMLDQAWEYVPGITVPHTTFTDKVNERKILPTDGLNPIQPREVGVV